MEIVIGPFYRSPAANSSEKASNCDVFRWQTFSGEKNPQRFLPHMLQSLLTIPFTPYLPRLSFPCRSITSITSTTIVAKSFCPHRFRTTQPPTKLASPHRDNTFSSLSSPSPNQSTTTATRRSDLVSRHLSSTTPSTTANMSYSKHPSEFTVRRIGAPNTLDFRAYIERDGQPLSSFHDVPLYANEQQTVLNMIVEIPRWTNAKLEVMPPLLSGESRNAPPWESFCCC
jgi:hypothetical protein